MDAAASDETLVRSTLEGDESAFAELVRRHKGRILALCGNLARCAADIDDLAQEVFLRAWRNLRQFRADAPFEHWLARIATRACYDHIRRQKPEPIPIEDLPLPAPDDSNASEARDWIRWAMAKLSAEDRLVIALLELEERSVRDVAAMTGWSESNVKVRAFRARQGMKARLESAMGKSKGTI